MGISTVYFVKYDLDFSAFLIDKERGGCVNKMLVVP